MIMDKKEKNFATYKEFAKMLREVANIYSKLGDEPLLKEGYEYNAIRDAVQYVTNNTILVTLYSLGRMSFYVCLLM